MPNIPEKLVDGFRKLDGVGYDPEITSLLKTMLVNAGKLEKERDTLRAKLKESQGLNDDFMTDRRLKKQELKTLRAKVAALENVLLSKHGGEPLVLLAELDTLREENDALEQLAAERLVSLKASDAAHGIVSEEIDTLRAKVEELEKYTGRLLAIINIHVHYKDLAQDIRAAIDAAGEK